MRRYSAEVKLVYARMMEIYAAYLEQTDFNIGRVVDAIEQTGELENTLVIYIIGDNGASAEGSMQGLLNEMTFFNHVPEDLKQVLGHVDDLGTWKTYNHYPVGMGTLPPMCARCSGPSKLPRISAALATAWSCPGPSESRTREASVPSFTT